MEKNYFPSKKITIYCGHYGSGKTNLAVNHAFALAEAGHKVKVLDLDIVNPYFRTKDSEEILASHGIGLIASEFANSNVDIPTIPAAAEAAMNDERLYTVVDVGGDDSGALALGRYSSLLHNSDYDMLLVVNKFRLLSRTASDTAEIAREIEYASRIRFTGIAACSNLGRDTTAETLLSAEEYTQELSELMALPVVYRAVRRDIYEASKDIFGKLERVQPVDIYGANYF